VFKLLKLASASAIVRGLPLTLRSTITAIIVYP